MPDGPAARVTDNHVCPLSDGPKPHVGGPILPPCAPTTQTGGLFQARASDKATCASAPDVIAMGSATVLVAGLPAARQTDQTAHGGIVQMGLPTVLIGGPVFSAPSITRTPNATTGASEFHYGSAINISEDPDNPDFQSQALAALIRLDTTPTMHGALDSLAATGHQLNIIPYVPPPGWGPFNAYCKPDDPNGARAPGVGTSSTVAWDPNVNGFGVPGTTPASSQPGSDVLLAHEVIHGLHNAHGSRTAGPTNVDKLNVGEERATVGLPAGVYDNPRNGKDPLNGTALPDTTGTPPTENAVRNDYANRGIPSPVTGVPPVQRPSYYPPTPTDAPGAPF